MTDNRGYNPLDPDAERKAEEEAAKLLSDFEKADFCWLMSDPRGRRIIWGLLEEAKVFHTSFAGKLQTFVNEGRRQVGLKYLSMIQDHCPEKYQLMVTEYNDARRNRKRG